MEGTQVFNCITTNSVKNILKKTGTLFLEVGNDAVKGRGYVCNADGENPYVGDFAFNVADIRDVSEGQYRGEDAFVLVAYKKDIYGRKKLRVYIPQLKDCDIAVGTVRRVMNGENDVVSKEAVVEETTVKAEAPVVEAVPEKPVVTEKAKAPEVKEPEVKKPEVEEPEVKKTKVEEPEVQVAEETSDGAITEEEFKKRMDKLNVLNDCGLIEEKEFISKKMELFGLYYNLSDFNDRIQKLVALKDCGLLSDAEFEKNKADIVKECGDLNVDDIEKYRSNIYKLLVLEVGGIITSEECDKNKMAFIQDVNISVNDSKDAFMRKLRRMRVLKDCGLMEEKEFNKRVDTLLAAMDITESDSKETMVDKLRKWPLLVQEGYIAQSELKNKKKELLAQYVEVKWTTPEKLKAVIYMLIVLKDGQCLTKEEFQSRREALLKEVDDVQDYSTRIAMYKILPETGIIGIPEYESLKQKCINRIFVDSNSVEEFKVRANNLMELQKAGIISMKEFEKYKSKLMSEL